MRRGVVEIGQHRIRDSCGVAGSTMWTAAPGGAEMDLVAPRLHVMPGIAAVEQEIAARSSPACPRRGRAGMHRRPFAVHEAAARRHQLDAARDGLGEADRFEQFERRLVDALHVALAQRLVLAAFHARPDGRFLHRNGPRPERPPRLAAAAPARQVFDHAHCQPPLQRSSPANLLAFGACRKSSICSMIGEFIHHIMRQPSCIRLKCMEISSAMAILHILW